MSSPSVDQTTERGNAATGEKSTLELQHLRKEVEKLGLEVEALRSSRWWDRIIGRYLPVITALLAVVGFWFGIIQYNAQRNDIDKQRAAADTARSEELRREAAKPFWDTQLKMYIRAAEAAATIATSEDAAVCSRAESEFWLLYWGPLACVEDVGAEKKLEPNVESAMVELGKYLKKYPKEPRNKSELQHLAIELAHAMRDELGPSFALQPTPLRNK